jgi:hypothetical protein
VSRNGGVVVVISGVLVFPGVGVGVEPEDCVWVGVVGV